MLKDVIHAAKRPFVARRAAMLDRRVLVLLGLGVFAALAIALSLPSAGPTAVAADAPQPDKADTVWMMLSCVLVLLMTVPGLALFYGGLVRAKNMLSLTMQVLYSVCVVSVLWFAVGYSLAFTDGPLVALIGGLGKAFLAGVTPASTVETFTKGVVIPEYAFAMFQMSFAAITPALIVGSFAERVRFPAVAAFIPLWSLLVYLPIAHMVWFWGGPSDPTGPSGFIFSLGALDFAGGTVVHINAGIAGLVGALFVGRRIGYGRDHMPPHALTMTFIGAALLWVGWFGFNAGSALEVGGTALLAMLNTFLATAAAALSWIAVEWTFRGKASLLGGLSGAIGGLVAVTPAAGFAGPGGALALGLAAGAFCFYCCTGLKNRFGYDDTLDVFGIHCTGGVLGAIATGVLAWPALGGSGVWDYATDSVGAFDPLSQVTAQALAVCITLLWSGSLSYLLFLAIDRTLGLRVSKDQEREGLDLADHGERAYNY